MHRPILSLICLLGINAGIAQSSDGNFVKVYGKIINEKDSTTVGALVSYEKLPYYDDVGTTRAGTDGEFEFYLNEGTSYSFTAAENGFDETTKEVLIEDPDKDGLFLFSIYIKPGEEFELITLDDLIFARGKAKITESSYQELDELVKWLEDRPNTIIQLEGHTDFAGNADANMNLSRARVEAVKEYLVKQKVHKNRVLTKAFGGTQPLMIERTDEAKTRNRRVEVRVIAN